jgi:hypothetical protein
MNLVTAALLTCGIVAGAMLPTVLWIDGATRPRSACGTTARVNSALANEPVCRPSTSCSAACLWSGLPSAYVESCSQDAARIGARPCMPPPASGSSRRE